MREKFMAIDVGLKRIGLAFGFGEVVTPLEPVLRKNRNIVDALNYFLNPVA